MHLSVNYPMFRRASLQTTYYYLLYSHDELYVFHSAIIWMGITKNPELSMYWALNPMLETSIFSKLIKYSKF